MNKLIYDEESEKFIREALSLEPKKDGEKVFGYVSENGAVKELKSFGELLEYVL